MKKNILIVILGLFSSQLKSQDILILKNGDSLKTNIIEVGINDITYKKFDTTSSNPSYKILKSSVIAIYYPNGTKDIFSVSNRRLDTSKEQIQNFVLKGYADAKKYYKGYKTVATITFASSLYSPVLGLIPAAVSSFSAPEYQNLGFPEESLMSNPDYKYGYIHKAKRIKQQKVWKNWLIPTSIWVGAITVITFALSGNRLIP